MNRSRRVSRSKTIQSRCRLAFQQHGSGDPSELNKWVALHAPVESEGRDDRDSVETADMLRELVAERHLADGKIIREIQLLFESSQHVWIERQSLSCPVFLKCLLSQLF